MQCSYLETVLLLSILTSLSVAFPRSDHTYLPTSALFCEAVFFTTIKLLETRHPPPPLLTSSTVFLLNADGAIIRRIMGAWPAAQCAELDADWSVGFGAMRIRLLALSAFFEADQTPTAIRSAKKTN